MVGKKEYAQINELLNARLDAKKVLIAVHRGRMGRQHHRGHCALP